MRLLEQKLSSAHDHVEKYHGCTFLDVSDEIGQVRLKDIVFIKWYGDHIQVVCKNEILNVPVTSANLEAMMPIIFAESVSQVV